MQKLRTWLEQERGRQAELARACDRTHGAISQWTQVPSNLVLVVEKTTGIPREELRPDLYGELESRP